ncbi:MAG: heavy metal-binding domain-containing protein [Litorimonas sp.]
MEDGFTIWELASVLFGFVPFLLLLLIGVSFGTIAQKRHLAELDRREAEMDGMVLTTLGHADGQRGELVTGSTVVAYDFFRRIAIVLRKLIGGRFRMHERFMERARREAILRMAEEARTRGASAVHNIRLVSANLGDSNNATGGCEIVAYGTAVWT